MTALTKDRPINQIAGDLRSDPVAAAVKIYCGAIVCLDASGHAVAGHAALNLKARGVAKEQVDNSTGTAGNQRVTSRVGVFRFLNDGANACDRTHIGAPAYIVDDQTVAATDADGTRSILGTIQNVTADGDVDVRIN